MASPHSPDSPAGAATAPDPVGPAAWRVALVGVLAGLASGLFGVGGGVVIVPGLVLVAAMGQRRAHGTSLTAIVPIATAGAIGYATAGEVDVAAAALMAVGALVGAPLGVAALARTPQRALRGAFGTLLVVTAVRLVVDTAGGAGREPLDLLGALGYLGTGLLSGGLAGLMGVGGGVVIVPLLTLLFGFPLVLAKGTSLAVIAPTAIVGTVRNLRHGTTDLRAGLLVGVGGVVTAAAASQVSLRLDRTVSAWTFAALLVLVGGRMVWQARRTDRPRPG